MGLRLRHLTDHRLVKCPIMNYRVSNNMNTFIEDKLHRTEKLENKGIDCG